MHLLFTEMFDGCFSIPSDINGFLKAPKTPETSRPEASSPSKDSGAVGILSGALQWT